MLDRKNKIVPEDLAEFSAADTIEETLSFYHITQTEFAKRIGISEKHLSQVLHRKAFISPTVALSIEEVTGIPAYMLLAKDTRYRLAHTTKPTPGDKANDPDFLKQYDWAMA
jgi:plasmid maintenance system antidote protein VapI